MTFKMASSPHQHNKRTTSQVMAWVIFACVPGIAVQCYFFGLGTVVQLLLAIGVALVTEAAIVELRGKNMERALKDNSAILTAVLLAISIPPAAPWWVIVIGTFFAIALVKQLYGGLGYNPFNPAMAAYIALLISFPVEMTSWLPPKAIAALTASPLDSVSLVFTGFTLDGYSLAQLRTSVDGVTMATPLDQVKTNFTMGYTFSETLENPIFVGASGLGWFWVNLTYLLGGLVLLKQRVINWHIPLGVLGGLFVMALAFYVVDGDSYGTPWFHLFSGATMLGAFFIATDPVSASTTDRGRIIFGLAIGFWVYIIRTWGGYPDAFAFSVVLMNMAVPLIDYYTQPRTYGHKVRGRDA